jgi:hypothetical protein
VGSWVNAQLGTKQRGMTEFGALSSAEREFQRDRAEMKHHLSGTLPSFISFLRPIRLEPWREIEQLLACGVQRLWIRQQAVQHGVLRLSRNMSRGEYRAKAS